MRASGEGEARQAQPRTPEELESLQTMVVNALGPPPEPRPSVEQFLFVQPNFEVMVYLDRVTARQLALIARVASGPYVVTTPPGDVVTLYCVMGLPPLAAGTQVTEADCWPAVATGAFTALLTAFYMSRLYFRVFEGRRRIPEGAHPHDAPAPMAASPR